VEKVRETEDLGRKAFRDHKRELHSKEKKIALIRLAKIMQTKSLMSTFELIRTAGKYNRLKVQMLRSMPKPRKKQWWEKVMAE
jgi:hypothetical protein